MQIDIQEIIIKKLAEMEQKKILEKKIEELVENTLLKTMESVIDSYSIRRMIEEKLAQDVKKGMETIGLTAYNTWIVTKMEELMNTVVKEDIADKIKDMFDSILVQKKEYVKLSEIVEEYRRLYDDIDYNDLQEMENGCFSVIWEEKEERYFEKLKLIFSQEPQRKSVYSYAGSNEKKIEICMNIRMEKKEKGIERKIGNIYWCVFEGRKIHDLSILKKHISDFEALMMNLVLNDTKVIIDMGESDIDSSVADYYGE